MRKWVVPRTRMEDMKAEVGPFGWVLKAKLVGLAQEPDTE